MTHHTNFKPDRVSGKVTRFRKRMDLKKKEDENKGTVRRRDKKCRFPRCGCKKFNIALHVSHKEHKGMGGDPTGERSASELMLYICAARHREHRFSIDKGTLRWHERDGGQGANGAIWWEMDVDRIPDAWEYPGLDAVRTAPDGWFMLAMERTPGVFEPFTPLQDYLLKKLAEMTV